MNVRNKTSKKHKPFFEELSNLAGISHRGIGLKISHNVNQPFMVGGTVFLPSSMMKYFDTDEGYMLVESFLHELKHARDWADHIDFDQKVMERRARKAESLVSKEEWEPAWKRHKLATLRIKELKRRRK